MGHNNLTNKINPQNISWDRSKSYEENRGIKTSVANYVLTVVDVLILDCTRESTW